MVLMNTFRTFGVIHFKDVPSLRFVNVILWLGCVVGRSGSPAPSTIRIWNVCGSPLVFDGGIERTIIFLISGKTVDIRFANSFWIDTVWIRETLFGWWLLKWNTRNRTKHHWFLPKFPIHKETHHPSAFNKTYRSLPDISHC